MPRQSKADKKPKRGVTKGGKFVAKSPRLSDTESDMETTVANVNSNHISEVDLDRVPVENTLKNSMKVKTKS